MAPEYDNRDPLEKLKDLHEWMLNNKPSDKHAAIKAVVQKPLEVQDFENWVKEIQSPGRVF